MRVSLSKALDQCLLKIAERKAIEDCLCEYPQLREKLEPLLNTAIFVAVAPRISLSANYKKESRDRLIAQLRK